ncbi:MULTISPECIES: hypothetical protein [Pseudomonas]|uniref:hypothetical protein n=1 Tax=Pseudomonas TaxID=286 RepID=UPI002360B7FE|nr:MULTISPECIES: hypothetical protein [Pseudomonas]WJV23186.1 hypothetical protein PSR66_26700 [Pseudomonas chlororaphis]
MTRKKRATKKEPRTNSGRDFTEVRAKILEALNNQAYMARTIYGISKEAHVGASEVLNTIRDDQELRMIIKVYPRRTTSGKILLTTKKRFKESASIKDKFIDLFATHHARIEDAS